MQQTNKHPTTNTQRALRTKTKKTGSLPALFTRDPAVRSLAGHLMPLVAASQPLNALAFTLDGLLYGAGGYRYAAGVMLVCAAPPLGLMAAGQVLGRGGAGGAPAAPSQQRHLLMWQQQQQHQAAWQQQHQQHLVGAAASAAVCWPLPSLQGYNSHAAAPGLGISSISCSSSPAALFSSSPLSSLVPWLQQQQHGGLLSSSGMVPGGPGSSATAAAAAAAAPSGTPVLPSEVLWVWAGLIALMAMRAATILLPLACRWDEGGERKGERVVVLLPPPHGPLAIDSFGGSSVDGS